MSGDKPLKDVESLVQDFQRSGLRELHLRAGDVEIYLSAEADAPGLDASSAPGSPKAPEASGPNPIPSLPTPPAVPSAGASAAAASSVAAAFPDLPEGEAYVRAPYLGTFYRAPKPGSPPYVEIGRRVEAGGEMCLVEVMKLFTAVQAESAGVVKAVLATDGQMVQADQPLFIIAAE